MTPRPTDRRVIPVPGTSGYAVAVTGAVAFIGDGDVIAQSVLDSVLRRAPDGGAILDQLTGLLSSSPALRYPGIAVVCDVAGGHEILVAGATEVAASGPHGSTRWRAVGPMPERHPVRTLDAVTLGTVHPRSLDGLDDLRRGTVACDGVAVIWSHDSHTTIPEPAHRRLRMRRARPTRIVSGIVCPAGHLDAPDAHLCRTCGAEIDPAHSPTRLGLRPPLATLVFDSGDAFEIADDAVIGRSVVDDVRVTVGIATPVEPGGDASALSRHHAWLVARGWSLELVDLGARNGTFLRRTGTPGWQRLEPGRAVLLAHGDHVAFAERVARVETPHRFRTGRDDMTSNQSATTERSDHAESR